MAVQSTGQALKIDKPPYSEQIPTTIPGVEVINYIAHVLVVLSIQIRL